MHNYYGASLNFPIHLSVGAVIFDPTDKTYFCHYFDRLEEHENMHLLMHKTVRKNETLEDAVSRGVKDEMGIDATVLYYLGSKVTNQDWKLRDGTANVEKTTLYFMLEVNSFNIEERDMNDRESHSEIKKYGFEEIVKIFEDQEEWLDQQDAYEADILKRAKELYESNN